MHQRKLAVVTPSWGNVICGVDVFNRDLKSALTGAGHSVDFFSLESILSSGEKLSGHEFELGNYFSGVNEREFYDVVICNGEYGAYVDHPRAINVFHGSSYGYANSLKGFESRERTLKKLAGVPLQRMASRGKTVVAVSNFATEGLSDSGIVTDRVINLSVDTAYFRPLCLNLGKYSLSVSRGDYYGKGLDILGRWAALIPEEVRFIGEYSGDLQGIVQEGKISHQALADYYNRARVFFNPSRFEGAGLTTLEAMACACPVIVTPTGYGIDIMQEIPQFVVGEQDSEGFLERHEEVSSNRERFSKLALDYFLEFHNPENFRNSWLNLVENL